MVVDSKFGHVTPIVFLRSWNVFITASFAASSRHGISNIPELSKKKLTVEEPKHLRDNFSAETESIRSKGVLDSESSNTEDEKESEKLRTKLQLFEKNLSLKEKGIFKVWKSDFTLSSGKKSTIFLHAINDSKPV